MAFDGVTIANVVSEMKKELIGGRLYKIAQPEEDELLLTIKQPTGQKRLYISAGASLPLIYLTELMAADICLMLSMIMLSSLQKIILLCFPMISATRVLCRRSPISSRCSILI